MSIQETEFRNGMRQLGGAVTIVSTCNGSVRAGLTATAVTSLSASPPRLLACINRQGATYETLSRGRTMCVNVLSSAHKDLAMRFAGMDETPETERFEDRLWHRLSTGAPALKDALVSFDCTVDSVLDVGSHGIVIGEITAVSFGDEDGAPLCYRDGQWATLVPLTDEVIRRADMA